jgi:aspartyl aminopeptidase
MNTAEDLIDFLYGCPTCFHTVSSAEERLQKAGYQKLYESEPWQLAKGGKYYVTRNGASLIAFRIPQEEYRGYMIAASHTDSPSLKIKENPEIKGHGYTKLNVEKYGGAILSGWLDRPLSCAGRVLVRKDGKIVSRLYRSEEDLFVIPSLAIHMNRQINEGMKWNVQTDLCPVFTLDEEGDFLQMIADDLQVKKEEILSHDLFLYVREKGRIIGRKKDMVLAAHLDDLQCGYGDLMGFLNSQESDHVPVLALFDNEETGSLSAQGADSTFLHDTLTAVSAGCGRRMEDSRRAIAESFMVSADNAHAVHPNHPEKADPVNQPHLNQGIVIKYNANQHYTSDAVSAAVFKMICEKAGVACQTFTNRSDMAGGSTLGNLSERHVSLHTVDIGLPQLAMHSCMETAGVKDTEDLIKAMTVFFSSSFTEDRDGYRI